jgi:hypothetical protein
MQEGQSAQGGTLQRLRYPARKLTPKDFLCLPIFERLDHTDILPHNGIAVKQQ